MLSKLPVDQLQRIAATGGGEYLPASESRQLIQKLNEHRAVAREETPERRESLANWRNDGIWLLPALLLCVPLIARRGWL